MIKVRQISIKEENQSFKTTFLQSYEGILLYFRKEIYFIAYPHEIQIWSVSCRP